MRLTKDYVIEGYVLKKNSELKERKQVGVLYHFTYIEKLVKILKDKGLKSEYNFISFTRNYSLINIRWSDSSFSPDFQVRLVFDGTKQQVKDKITLLSQKLEIPVNIVNKLSPIKNFSIE